ncbi:hypothetical protein LP415_03615 [Polaromonas sp. P1(28)-8]|nr:hypothetical protein LP415_03615 [Polaromonas sp. P1(28)-8]
MLRKGETSLDATADEILQMIKSIVGDSEKRLAFQRKLENQLQQGTMPIPYAWRPKQALSNIHDVVQLWEATKRSGGDDKKYHLTMTMNEWKHTAPQTLVAKVPLIDLISLLVLSDLGLLPPLFKLFSKIAISQSTLLELSRLTHTMSGSPWRSRCQQLQQELKTYLDQILQPSAEYGEDDERNDGFSKATEVIKNLCVKGSYQLYSDDALFRLYALGADGAPQGVCTLDVIDAMEERELLTAVEAAHLVSKLCAWHVGVHVLFRYQVAILPDALVTVKNVQSGIGLLQGTPSYIAMATAIWDVRASVEKLYEHMASVIRRLIENVNLSDIAIASVVGVWYLKMKLHDEALSPAIGIIANTLALSAAALPTITVNTSKRFWNILMAMVELDHGNSMDEDKEREAIRLMAKLCVGYDVKAPDLPESFKDRFLKGLTKDTSPADTFLSAYTETAIANQVAAMKKKA